ncbi:hypothetical protein KAX17_14765, partial [Candidatus Bipolaricaulota bacterium]|nr:hypothetical protein [Candidatus Bipolaricaulota bacterium]
RNTREHPLEYYIHGSDGQAIQATLQATNPSSIALSGDGYKEVLELDSFSKRWQIGEPVIVPETKEFIAFLIMASVITALFLLLIGVVLIEERKRKRVSRLLVTREEACMPKKA